MREAKPGRPAASCANAPSSLRAWRPVIVARATRADGSSSSRRTARRSNATDLPDPDGPVSMAAPSKRAATIVSARVIGRQADLGTIEPGKIADLVVLDRDPRTDIRNTLAIHAVMQSGRLRDGETMDELWPEVKSLPRRWYCDDRPPGTPDPCAQQRK